MGVVRIDRSVREDFVGREAEDRECSVGGESELVEDVVLLVLNYE